MGNACWRRGLCYSSRCWRSQALPTLGDLSLDPKAQGLAHYIMAVCHDLNGESAQAISEYQKSVKFNGLEPAPRLKLGAYYLRLDKHAQAAHQLKAVTRHFPSGSPGALFAGPYLFFRA